jgi:hypothetical protein
MKTRTATLRQPKDRRSERGLTLPEALIAITVFAIVFISALTLYSVASSTYLRTDSAVIQQQNIRFTMDKMSETLRDAGAGHNMLGSRRLADEQIEGTWESAVFVRGDFDGMRETALEDAAGFPIVTTGNDEIVGFVVRKAKLRPTDPDPNTISLTIRADLTGTGGKRDAVFTDNDTIAGEETATVMVAASTLAEQTAPPYQLVRVTFAANGTPQYEVVAENINKLSFTYGTLDAAVLPNGGDNGDLRAERASIRRIGVRLVGMTDRTDLAYTKNAGAGTGFRTFPLETTILPANLGIVGGPHSFAPATALPVPASITDCTGHCRQHLVTWEPADGVTTYSLVITAPATASLAAFSDSQIITGTEYPFQDPPDDIAAGITRPFTFKVAAMSGTTIGTYTSGATLQAQNDAASVPEKPTNVLAAGATGENAMSVTWNAVTNNTGSVTSTSMCVSSAGSGAAPPSPWNSQAKDLKNSKVYRVRSTGSNTGADAVADVSDQQLGTIKNAVSNTAFIDRTAAPCSAYFYRVKACDLCDVTSAASDPMATAAAFVPVVGVDPAKPPAAPTPVTPVGSDGTNYTVQLQWSPVIVTSTNRPAAVAHYVVERWARVGAAAYAKQVEYDVYESTTGPIDTVPINNASSQKIDYRYFVRAVYDCTPIRPGALSDPYDLACTPPATNTISITQAPQASVITRPAETSVPLAMTVTGTGWTSATLQIQNAAGTVVFTPPALTTPDASGVYTFASWNVAAATIPDGIYTVKGSAVVNNACRAEATPVTFQIETTACGQRIVQPAFAGNGSNVAEQMVFKIENTCPAAVTISQLTLTWTTNVLAALRVTSLAVGSTDHYRNNTGVASAQSMPLSANIVLAAGSVATPSISAQFTLDFDGDRNFTSTGDQNGTLGRFTSIVAKTTFPSATNEQLIDGVTQIP